MTLTGSINVSRNPMTKYTGISNLTHISNLEDEMRSIVIQQQSKQTRRRVVRKIESEEEEEN